MKPSCPDEVHLAIKANPARWESDTVKLGVTEDEDSENVYVMDWRNCRVCDGTMVKEKIRSKESILNFARDRIVSPV